MAFNVNKVCAGKSLPVTYWRIYSIKEFNPAMRRAVVTVAGYSTKESRDIVGDNPDRVDQFYDFLIENYTEVFDGSANIHNDFDLLASNLGEWKAIIYDILKTNKNSRVFFENAEQI